MSKVKVRVEGHYEVQEVAYGKDYVWVPAHASIECDCGRIIDVAPQNTTCPNCGADYATVVREVAGRHLSDDVLHPWHPEYEEWAKHRKEKGRLSEFYESPE